MENKEFLPNDNLSNRPYWLYKNTGKGREYYKPRPGTPSTIQENLNSSGGDIQYVWDNDSHETYTAYHRNPSYRPVMTKIVAPVNGLEVAQVSVPKLNIGYLPPSINSFLYVYNVDGMGQGKDAIRAYYSKENNDYEVYHINTYEQEKFKDKQTFFKRVRELNKLHPIIHYKEKDNSFISRHD